MNYFHDWLQFQNSLITEHTNTHLKIVTQFLYNSIKICGTCTYHNLKKYEKHLFVVFKNIIETGNYSMDQLKFISMNTEEVLNFQELIRLYFDGTEPDLDVSFFPFTKEIIEDIKKDRIEETKKNVTYLLKAIYFVILIVVEKYLFHDIETIFQDESKNSFELIMKIKSICKEGLNQNPHLNFSLDEKSRLVDFMTSPWKPQSNLILYHETFHEKMKISNVTIEQNGLEYVIYITNATNDYESSVIRNEKDELFYFNKTKNYLEKTSYSLRSSFQSSQYPMCHHSYSFLFNALKNITDFVYRRTVYSNKKCIDLLKTHIIVMRAKFSIEKQKLMNDFHIANKDYTRYANGTHKIKVMEEYHTLETYDYDYYFFCNPSMNIIHGYENLTRDDCKYYFNNEIILKSNRVYLKHDSLFYKEFPVKQSDLHEIMAKYKLHVLKRKEKCKQTFGDGIYHCSLIMLDQQRKHDVNLFLEFLVDRDFFQSHSSSPEGKVYIIMIRGLTIPLLKYEICDISNILSKFCLLNDRELKQFYKRMDRLRLQKCKMIKVFQDTIEYKDDSYFYEKKEMDVKSIQETIKKKHFSKRIMIQDIFSSFETQCIQEQTCVDFFKEYIYNCVFHKDLAMHQLQNNWQKVKDPIILFQRQESESYLQRQKKIINQCNRQINVIENKKDILEYLKEKRFVENFTNFLDLYDSS